MKTAWLSMVAGGCGVVLALAGCSSSGTAEVATDAGSARTASLVEDVALEPREIRFENGQVKEAWSVRLEAGADGSVSEVREGPVTWYYADGVVDRRGAYRDGEEAGVWTYWWDDGSLKGRGPYVEGKKQGRWTFWDQQGGRTTGSYDADQRDGVWQTFDADGTEIARVHFDHDVPAGEWLAFDASGSLVQLTNYEHGVRHGEYREWWPDGTARTAGSFEQGMKNGLYREWWPSGAAKSLGHWADDQRVGTWKTWYENGGMDNWETLGVYTGGEKHGYWVTKHDGASTFGLKVYLVGGKPFPFPEEWIVRWWGPDESRWPVQRPPLDPTEQLREMMEQDPSMREALERAQERDRQP